LLSGVSSAARADESNSGTPFFLLSDAAYGTSETALVRLEAPELSSISEYGGVDVYVYQVKQPLDFLKAQNNLHRIDVNAKFVGTGLANALAKTWDEWWLASRLAWRKLFTRDARQAVTKQAEGVRTHPLIKAPTPQVLNPLYKPLTAHTLVDSFRYPLHLAKPIAPPAGVKLDGSSSQFITASVGNVMIPLGKKAPGLYLVEAMVGAHRAVTLVFVSDTIAVTKVSGAQMLVWLAGRNTGKPVAGGKVVWSDGVGVLASGNSDAKGVAQFARQSPEKTYVYGSDPQGGVFVAENYYYDSEIYNTKLYAVTDRPLYRPGETVFVKFIGRNFKNARESSPLAAGDIKLQVFDANGFPVAGQTVPVQPNSGGDTAFQLPDNAVAGGYELRFDYQGNHYGAAFRVDQYQKPHFEINILPEKRDYKTNQEVTGKLQLRYPDGKPVKNAKVELTLRGQRLSMVEGDLGYAGQFPLQLASAQLQTNRNGEADFVLPAAKEPSRYVLSTLATDGAAYRVRATKEILIERAASTWQISAERAFSATGEAVNFSFALGAQTGLGTTAAVTPGTNVTPVSWEWVRLEDQKRAEGKLDAALVNALANASAKASANSANSAPNSATGRFAISFAEAGSYTVTLRDGNGNIVGALPHYVSGGSVKAPQGSITMVFDKAQYQPGDTASALITFPQPVEQALLTLERDAVEKTALLASGEGWAKTRRISDSQWRVEMPVTNDYGPNITLSVVYVKGGEYVFQNLGLKVAQPKISVAVQSDKAVYAPGEKVTIQLAASINGKSAPGTVLTVGVVDEMVYVLQPEIAPDLFDFFYHPRRNNVRTSASLSFIGYDLARPPGKQALPGRSQTQQRALKVQERPRREDKDTALWQPSVVVDARGRASVSFIMPDSLTRWRITVRASEPGGVVGQNQSWLRSDKPFYVKWTSPSWARVGDAPVASVAVFNQGNTDATLDFSAKGPGVQQQDKIKLKPGANFVALPLKPQSAAATGRIDLALSDKGKTVDALIQPFTVVPVPWLSQRSQLLFLAGAGAAGANGTAAGATGATGAAGAEIALKLPADATQLKLQLVDGASAQFRRLIDDLIDYPYGCVEQTASRLIPYSLALQSVLPGEERLKDSLRQRLHSYRFRLAQMAGPQATFGWWSVPDKDGDPLLTAYAYYADWHASRALKLDLPPEHFERLLDVYSKQSEATSPWQRALMLYFMQEMGLPVRSLAEALNDKLGDAGSAGSGAHSGTNPAANVGAGSGDDGLPLGTLLASSVFTPSEGELQLAMARVLNGYVVQQSKGSNNGAAASAQEAAVARLAQLNLPLADALLLLAGKKPATNAEAILQQVRAEYATIDRALTLLWLHRALGGSSLLRQNTLRAEPDAPWQGQTTASGGRIWQWPGANALPSALKLKTGATPGSNLAAIVQYQSRDPETSDLPVKVTRHLYRLVRVDPPAAKTEPAKKGKPAAKPEPVVAVEPGSEGSQFKPELLAADAVLSSDEVYLDEVELLPSGSTPLRFGILEVPLPPGTSADKTTWGIRLQWSGDAKGDALEKARYEVTDRGYAVPVDELNGKFVVRHLIRPAQSGKFGLPPARYYRMYQPEQKALEEKARGQIEIR
jgi:uncharacterized protein YfaS (alpha-2-macroglobulin family)